MNTASVLAKLQSIRRLHLAGRYNLVRIEIASLIEDLSTPRQHASSLCPACGVPNDVCPECGKKPENAEIYNEDDDDSDYSEDDDYDDGDDEDVSGY